MAIGRWYAAFIEPRSYDEDEQRRERILNIILVGSILMLGLFDGIVLYYSLVEGAAYHDIPFIIFSVLPAFFVLLYALSRRGCFVLASYLLIAAYFLSISYASFRWGINLPAALLGYALLITMSSILVGSRFGFVATSVISAFMIAIWHFQFYGMLPMDHSTRNNSDALVFAILFFLLTTVAWLSNREIEKALARARRSERAVKVERDLLEVKVVERTRELQAVQLEKIDHLYRFAEFGQLASGLFHDLLNLVNTVSLRAELNAGSADEAKALLNTASNAQTEIDRFREAFRKQLSREELSEKFIPKESIEHAMQFLGYPAKQAGVRMEFSGEAFEYFGNPLKFHQIVVNLILNAIESFEKMVDAPSGRRRITIGLKRINGEVILSVEDNGCGMSEALQAKIFEPFFTTKDGHKKGIGIGLAITKRIIENDLRGKIAVESIEGNGTTFLVSFPQNNESIQDIASHQSGTISYPNSTGS